MAGELNDGTLHAEADAEERHLVLTGVADGADFAFHAAVAEAAGNKNAIHVAEEGSRVLVRHFLAVHVLKINGEMVREAAVHESFVQALVGFLEIHILAHDGNGDGSFGMLEIVNHLAPGIEVRVVGRQAEHDGHLLVKAFLKEFQGQFVHIGYVDR